MGGRKRAHASASRAIVALALKHAAGAILNGKRSARTTRFAQPIVTTTADPTTVMLGDRGLVDSSRIFGVNNQCEVVRPNLTAQQS
jgi:hypothetical protein